MTKRIIILNVTNTVPQRSILIAKTLSSLRHECFLWNWQREERGFNTPEFKTLTIKTGKRFVYFATKVFLRLIKESCDCIVFSDFRLFSVVGLVSKMKNAKIFYDSQEVPIITAAERLKKVIPIGTSSLIKMLKFLEYMFLKCVDGMITIPLQDVEIERYSRLVTNIEVVRNFPSLSVKSAPTERLSSTLKEKRFIIYAGTIAQYTGLYLYFEVIRKLREIEPYSDVMLVLAGKLSGISAEELQTAIKNMQLKDSVVYLGWIPYKELLSIISHAQIGLALFNPNHLKFSYISEGTSRKIYTYMYCGIPVITNPPLGEFVRHEKCGIVIPYNIEELYSAVVNLLKDDGLRRKLGQNGKNAVLTKYNWERESEKVIKVFENMWSVKQCCRK